MAVNKWFEFYITLSGGLLVSRRGTILGIILISLGISILLNNFNVPKSFAIIVLGLIIIFLFYKKRQNAFLIIGLITVISGVLSVLKEFNIFVFRIKGDFILLLIGIAFVLLYYLKKNIGFLFPGTILLSLAAYLFLIEYFNNQRLWPSFFVLLGLAFYAIYFIAFYEEDSWPLVIGTIFNFLGILLLGFSYGFIGRSTLKYLRYILPLVFIYLGVLIMLRIIKRKS